jgi:phage shock protein A
MLTYDPNLSNLISDIPEPAEMTVDEELAREALKRRQTYQANADGMAAQVAQQKDAVEKLIASTRLLEGKMAEARSKKDTLKARAASAKTSKRVNEMVGSLSTSSALGAFERMEEKVLAMESEAEAVAQLTAPDELATQFQLLEGGGVDDDLAALKREMLGGSASAKAELPPGRRVSDAIEGELELALIKGSGQGPNQFRQGGGRCAAKWAVTAAQPGQGLNQGQG